MNGEKYANKKSSSHVSLPALAADCKTSKYIPTGPSSSGSVTIKSIPVLKRCDYEIYRLQEQSSVIY